MAVKNRQNLTLRMNIKMFNGNDLPHELLLTTRQQTKLRNAFENNMSLSKAQISEIIQSGELLGSLLSKIAGTLMKEAVSLTKNIWAPLGITAAASAINAANQKKKKKKITVLEQLMISNEEINDIMKILQALKDSNILLKGITKTIEN